MRKPVFGKMDRGLKFRIKEVEGLYYLCSETKGADQLRSYCTADLRLCFRICKRPFFSKRGSFVTDGRTAVRSYIRMLLVRVPC